MSLKSILYLGFLTCIACSLNAVTVTGSGSDLLGERVQAALVQAFRDEGIQLNFQRTGSLRGWRDLSSGSAQFGILATADSVPVNPSLPQYPVAFQVAKFAVHTSNPLTSISFSQLASLYAQGGTLRDWRSLVSDPEWANRQIIPGALRSPNSMALEVFSAQVIRGDDFKREVRFGNDADLLAASFVQSQNHLILLPAMPEGRNFRFLSVNMTDAGQAYSPSPDNVFFGDYPLRLPFYLVLADSNEADLQARIVRAVFTPAVMAAFEEEYFLPVPETEREAVLEQYP